MKETTAQIIIGALCLLGLGFLIGTVVGTFEGVRAAHDEAIRVGVAHYEFVNGDTNIAVKFSWIIPHR